MNDFESNDKFGGGVLRSSRSSPWNGVGKAGCRAAFNSDSLTDEDEQIGWSIMDEMDEG